MKRRHCSINQKNGDQCGNNELLPPAIPPCKNAVEFVKRQRAVRSWLPTTFFNPDTLIRLANEHVSNYNMGSIEPKRDEDEKKTGNDEKKKNLLYFFLRPIFTYFWTLITPSKAVPLYLALKKGL